MITAAECLTVTAGRYRGEGGIVHAVAGSYVVAKPQWTRLTSTMSLLFCTSFDIRRHIEQVPMVLPARQHLLLTSTLQPA